MLKWLRTYIEAKQQKQQAIRKIQIRTLQLCEEQPVESTTLVSRLVKEKLRIPNAGEGAILGTVMNLADDGLLKKQVVGKLNEDPQFFYSITDFGREFKEHMSKDTTTFRK